MPRINPTITDAAYKIYEQIPLKDKKHFVSDAIIEKHNRDNNTDELQELKAKVKTLEDRVAVLERDSRSL